MSLAFSLERQVALSAVARACRLTSSVFNKLVKNETVTKDDKSPVTVGDYSAQAVVNTILSRAFPDDPIVGEEDASDLKSGTSETAQTLRKRITDLANEALTADLAYGDVADWGLGPGRERTTEELLNAIDRGNHAGGATGRMWTLDPIDGTKGFLRGEQYAVCLALIVNSRVELGVMGCPNLPHDLSKPDGPRGSIFVAVRGQGAEQRTLTLGDPKPLQLPRLSISELSFLESVEAAHSSHSFNDRVSSTLGITKPPTRMDSQAKYCALARGDGGAYLRMPTGVGYKEKIWDHASGSLLVTEAGGMITDGRGAPLDFGLGRTLGENFGIVAAGADVHPLIIAAIKQTKL
ncbi:3(2),5-bisphosphate nucleotidase HAL2 [Sistotremastrum niveocremeum HHB9708]|uniref:3'(2'),5'-bisphosphate nucleotidase n=1 Tax=Sistotremastrum niveocremeum HHB9708 TaxID=1314777 RepID=A0A164PJR5_9AGAM|nr:3(2),5-bisphosphate nucleotidase HAL2 [Sistotremastrum niveocremeum HHB9708]